MKVFCYEHPNIPMELRNLGYVGDSQISLRFKCINKDCNCQIEVMLDKHLVIMKGVDMI